MRQSSVPAMASLPSLRWVNRCRGAKSITGVDRLQGASITGEPGQGGLDPHCGDAAVHGRETNEPVVGEHDRGVDGQRRHAVVRERAAVGAAGCQAVPGYPDSSRPEGGQDGPPAEDATSWPATRMPRDLRSRSARLDSRPRRRLPTRQIGRSGEKRVVVSSMPPLIFPRFSANTAPARITTADILGRSIVEEAALELLVLRTCLRAPRHAAHDKTPGNEYKFENGRINHFYTYCLIL